MFPFTLDTVEEDVDGEGKGIGESGWSLVEATRCPELDISGAA